MMNPIFGARFRGVLSSAAMALILCGNVSANEGVEEAQSLLKERGFYSGPVNGSLDADTKGAVRRFQLYSGLNGTGALDDATLAKLKETEEGNPGANASAVAPSGAASIPSSEPPVPEEKPEVAPQREVPPSTNAESPQGEPASAPLATTYSQFFRGTVYERSPEATQRKVVIHAEDRLTRHRLYDGPRDGHLTDALEEGIIRYQSRARLPISGRLDGATLRALGLTAPASAPPPPTMGPRSRGVYEGRLVKPGTPITLEP